MTLLRLITCGSVDDGKSTLIGRLLHECGSIRDDELEGLRTKANGVDYALLFDGLEAEREQGITIDVAYRRFETARRAFVLIDAPGHEQYTRNMATGASRADLAIVLVDARKGVLTQTRRHAHVARLLGVRRFVVAVNKMDLVGWDEAVFDAIRADFLEFAGRVGIDDALFIPISALHADNLAKPSPAAPWYVGPPLLRHLEEVALDDGGQRPFRMPVQLVTRVGPESRGYAGTIVGGSVRIGDRLCVLPSGRKVTVDRIVTMDGDLSEAVAGQSVTLSFEDHVDCSRGDVLAAERDPPQGADQFEATLIWMGEEALLPGRQYALKLATQNVLATVQTPKYRINADTQEQLAAKVLELNDIGVANLWTARPIVFEPYETSRELGGFILIDRLTNATVAAGLIHHALRRSVNVHEQILDVTPESRAAIKGQAPKLLWFTGLSGAGKSTIANLVEQKLHLRGRHTFLLDGDNLRLGLNKDLGFTDADRIENIRRAGESARLMLDAGLIVLCAFISPFRAERRMVREMLPAGDFIEIFVDTPLAEAERRDVKGLYKKARAGRLRNFTGIDSPYEEPERSELRIDTATLSAEDAADLIVAYLES
ncbi:adenylyl-sulfate kinase [Sphingomonas sp. LY54]|uniref:adenylyl-sulfate kinase n=1 Tax=Sphingomonas sp. LY54 TaxID=3095343 RepID=UPI002D77A4E8|nr:adenylyl-sulfate kinase [Sphingomonas sp. LY54]WRP29656.1 adenylyl-sulfate kinase [Sphingomonas sp. LY54]